MELENVEDLQELNNSDVGSTEENEQVAQEQYVPDPRIDAVLTTLESIQNDTVSQNDYTDQLNQINDNLIKLNNNLDRYYSSVTVSDNTVSENNLFTTSLNEYTLEQMLLFIIFVVILFFGLITMIFKGVK